MIIHIRRALLALRLRRLMRPFAERNLVATGTQLDLLDAVHDTLTPVYGKVDVTIGNEGLQWYVHVETKGARVKLYMTMRVQAQEQ